MSGLLPSLGLFDSTSLTNGLGLDAAAPPAPLPPSIADRPELSGTTPAPQRRAPAATDFRLAADRPLAKTWRGRAEDNIAAIRVMKALAGGGRAATSGDQERLIRFVGFGATELATSCFRRPGASEFKPGWEEIGAALKASVTEAEYTTLARSTQYAHYTPELLIRAVWSGLERLGFAGGRILEPGIGTGLFLALMPKDCATGSAVTGIEFDGISAGIARLLYPSASIRHEDFTRTRLSGSYDLAVGNPPYSDRTVQADPTYRGLGLRLHDFFLAKAIDAVRPGGLAAFVTSTGTMDKIDATARQHIARTADLIAAIRIPEGSFRATAGTDVAVDLLFWRKRGPDESAGGSDWEATETAGLAAGGTTIINRYWLDHPEMVLGEHALRRSQHGESYTCMQHPGADLAAMLAAAIARMPEGLYQRREAGATDTVPDELPIAIGTAADGALLKEGSFFIGDDGRLRQILDSRAVPVPVRGKGGRTGLLPKQARILEALLPIRDAVRQILRAQAADQPWQDAQRRLRVAYMSFTRQFGAINRTLFVESRHPVTGEVTESQRRPNLQPFTDDPDCWLVSSIEEYDQETGRGRMGPIFTERVVAPPAAPVVVSAADALAVSLNELGRIDLAAMADMLDQDEAALLAELGDAVFRDPATEEWQTADAYLSGAVRTKLAVAEASASLDTGYQRNVAALKAVQPEDLKPSQITARLGAPWIPSEDVGAFSKAVIGIATQVRHDAGLGVWSVDTAPFANDARGTSQWGTSRRNAGQLLADALESRTPQIFDTVIEDGSERRVLNVEATEAAKEKLAKIKLAFEQWIWTDPDRTERLARIYNDRFNNLVTRHFPGDHLTLAGASPIVSLYPLQKRVIWRIVTAGRTYIAHHVGSGKTYSVVAAVMEQRRLGLVSKPMIVVPGHCLAQFSREFLALYPQARILVADETNFASGKRHRFLARAATASWDAIVITHSAFKLIAVPAAFERTLVEDAIGEYERLLIEVDGDDRLTRKRIERLKEGMEAKLEGLRTVKDDMLTLDEIGVDQIIVDEAQEYRKLSFATNQTTLKGIDPDGSARAWDLWVKSRFTETKRPGRGLILASGTPITNTLGEMYTIQRYMDPGALVERHIDHFDAWAANFGATRTELELQPSGLYKPVTRFTEFVNVPDMVAMFRCFADVVSRDDLRSILKLPRIRGGQREILTAPASDGFRGYQQELSRRIEAIEARQGPPEPGDDILLAVITDGRHAAIDMRLVDPLAEDEPANKLNLLIDTVFRIWRDTADNRYTRPDGSAYERPGATQMIFSDLGTLTAESTRGFSAYRWIRDRLVALGVPAAEIAIIQEFKRAEAKQRLIGEFNTGVVRILLGSSDTMGTGVNGQRRLKALHHLDVPWLPSKIEQREGRIERQGNENDEIEIYAYATLGSMDATMWQHNERKARMVAVALAGDRGLRRIEDLEAGQSNQFAMAKALASGDQRLMQKAGLEADIARLERQRAAHFDDQLAVRRAIRDAEAEIARAEARIAGTAADIAARQPAQPFRMAVGAGKPADAESAGAAVLALVRQLNARRRDGAHQIAHYRGFALAFEGEHRFTGRYGYQVFLQRHGRDQETGINLGSQAGEVTARIDALLDGFEDEIAEAHRRISRERERIGQYQGQLGRPFAHEALLAEKRNELDAVERSLAANGVPLNALDTAA